MGRIANEAPPEIDTANVWRNRVDDILDELDDDEDRAVVLGWLTSNLGAVDIVFRLDGYGIACHEKAVQHWRRAQRLGRGRTWDV